MYIKKFLKHYYVMLVPGISLAYFLQYRSDVRNYYGIRGLQSGTWNAEIAFCWTGEFSVYAADQRCKTGDCKYGDHRCGEDHRQYHRAAYLCDPAE